MRKKQSYPYAEKLLDQLEREGSLKGKKPEGDRLAAIKKIKQKLKLLMESSDWGPEVPPEQKAEIRTRYFQSGLETREETQARLAKDRERKKAKRIEQRNSRMDQEEYLKAKAQRIADLSKMTEALVAKIIIKPRVLSEREKLVNDLMEKYEILKRK